MDNMCDYRNLGGLCSHSQLSGSDYADLGDDLV